MSVTFAKDIETVFRQLPVAALGADSGNLPFICSPYLPGYAICHGKLIVSSARTIRSIWSASDKRWHVILLTDYSVALLPDGVLFKFVECTVDGIKDDLIYGTYRNKFRIIAQLNNAPILIPHADIYYHEPQGEASDLRELLSDHWPGVPANVAAIVDSFALCVGIVPLNGSTIAYDELYRHKLQLPYGTVDPYVRTKGASYRRILPPCHGYWIYETVKNAETHRTLCVDLEALDYEPVYRDMENGKRVVRGRYSMCETASRICIKRGEHQYAEIIANFDEVDYVDPAPFTTILSPDGTYGLFATGPYLHSRRLILADSHECIIKKLDEITLDARSDAVLVAHGVISANEEEGMSNGHLVICGYHVGDRLGPYLCCGRTIYANDSSIQFPVTSRELGSDGVLIGTLRSGRRQILGWIPGHEPVEPSADIIVSDQSLIAPSHGLADAWLQCPLELIDMILEYVPDTGVRALNGASIAYDKYAKIRGGKAMPVRLRNPKASYTETRELCSGVLECSVASGMPQIAIMPSLFHLDRTMKSYFKKHDRAMPDGPSLKAGRLIFASSGHWNFIRGYDVSDITAWRDGNYYICDVRHAKGRTLMILLDDGTGVRYGLHNIDNNVVMLP